MAERHPAFTGHWNGNWQPYTTDRRQIAVRRVRYRAAPLVCVGRSWCCSDAVRDAAGWYCWAYDVSLGRPRSGRPRRCDECVARKGEL